MDLGLRMRNPAISARSTLAQNGGEKGGYLLGTVGIRYFAGEEEENVREATVVLAPTVGGEEGGGVVGGGGGGGGEAAVVVVFGAVAAEVDDGAGATVACEVVAGADEIGLAADEGAETFRLPF